MSTYARIENNQPIEYPIFEGQLQERFPSMLVPLDPTNDLLPNGYVRVLPNNVMEFKWDCKYVESVPVCINGNWYQGWDEIPLSVEEKTERQTVVANSVRKKRDMLLRESDILVMVDRWETYDSLKKDSIRNYRQLLRDLPQQTEFPFNPQFPVLDII